MRRGTFKTSPLSQDLQRGAMNPRCSLVSRPICLFHQRSDPPAGDDAHPGGLISLKEILHQQVRPVAIVEIGQRASACLESLGCFRHQLVQSADFLGGEMRHANLLDLFPQLIFLFRTDAVMTQLSHAGPVVVAGFLRLDQQQMEGSQFFHGVRRSGRFANPRIIGSKATPNGA